MFISRHALDSGVAVTTMPKVVERNTCHGQTERNVVTIIGVNVVNVYIATGMLFRKLMEDGVRLLSKWDVGSFL